MTSADSYTAVAYLWQSLEEEKRRGGTRPMCTHNTVWIVQWVGSAIVPRFRQDERSRVATDMSLDPSALLLSKLPWRKQWLRSPPPPCLPLPTATATTVLSHCADSKVASGCQEDLTSRGRDR